MPKYLISFERGAMDHIPAADWAELERTSRAAVEEAKDAGVLVFAGGLDYRDDDVEHAVVATDGTVTDGPFPEDKELVSGVTIVDVPTREDALKWAAKIAAGCRCAQDVRKFGDPAPTE